MSAPMVFDSVEALKAHVQRARKATAPSALQRRGEMSDAEVRKALREALRYAGVELGKAKGKALDTRVRVLQAHAARLCDAIRWRGRRAVGA